MTDYANKSALLRPNPDHAFRNWLILIGALCTVAVGLWVMLYF